MYGDMKVTWLPGVTMITTGYRMPIFILRSQEHGQNAPRADGVWMDSELPLFVQTYPMLALPASVPYRLGHPTRYQPCHDCGAFGPCYPVDFRGAPYPLCDSCLNADMDSDAATWPDNDDAAGFIAGVSEVQCERCGEWLPENEDTPTWRVYGGNYTLHDACAAEPHWHVVEFINGCLNDYDSGPYLSLEDAQSSLAAAVENWNADDDFPGDAYIPAGTDRYERGLYICKVEECRESTCWEES